MAGDSGIKTAATDSFGPTNSCRAQCAEPATIEGPCVRVSVRSAVSKDREVLSVAARAVNVQPGALLAASESVDAHLLRAAEPPAAVPPATPLASPVDAAADSVAASMQTRTTTLSAQLGPKGPALQATTSAGVGGLQAQDARNSAAVAALNPAEIGKGLGGSALGVSPMGWGAGGPPPLKPAAPPKFPLDLSAIQRLAPGAPGPYGYTELVPGSGVWIPDPAVNALHPGTVGPTAKAPLDLGDIVRQAPGQLGPRGYQELVPGSGVWVPDPNSPGFVPTPPKFPLDMNSVVRLAPGELGPPGYQELVPGSGVWVPDPRAPH